MPSRTYLGLGEDRHARFELSAELEGGMFALTAIGFTKMSFYFALFVVTGIENITTQTEDTGPILRNVFSK